MAKPCGMAQTDTLVCALQDAVLDPVNPPSVLAADADHRDRLFQPRFDAVELGIVR